MKKNFLILFFFFFYQVSFANMIITNFDEKIKLTNYGREVETRVKVRISLDDNNKYYKEWKYIFDERLDVTVTEAKVIGKKYKTSFNKTNNELLFQFDNAVNGNIFEFVFKYRINNQDQLQYIRNEYVSLPSFANGAQGNLTVIIPNNLAVYSLNRNFIRNGNIYTWKGKIPNGGFADFFSLTLKKAKWQIELLSELIADNNLSNFEMVIPLYFKNGNNNIDYYKVEANYPSNYVQIVENKDSIITSFKGVNNRFFQVKVNAFINNDYDNKVWVKLNPQEYLKIDQNLSEYEWLSLKENVSLTKISCIKNFGLEIILFALLTYGLYLLSQNELSLINFVTFQSMYMYLMGPLKEVIEVLPKYAYLKGILTKISEYYALEEEDLTKPIVKMVNKKIVIQNLTFAYTPLKENLTNVSLTIESGEHVFLKGPSGSGKSTLCKLLTQEINGYTGNILIGEQNILDYNLASIRANIVYLGQNEELMKTSIKENILYGTHVLNENYHTVCQICHIEDIVSKKGLRHESLVTEINLSGGEKQRILLARTLLKNGEIYLLDEALSEVEKALEKEIILAVRKYLTGKTLIYISHHDEAKLFERVVKIS